MKKNVKYRFAIAGAGFSGAVLARELVTNCDCTVTIFEERSHIGGNCYSEKDAKTGIEIHQYGPHIFNTNFESVWHYVNRFCHMGTYIHQVKANTTKGVFSLPINLDTINRFFNKNFSPKEAEAFLQTLGDKSIAEPKNFEEFALKHIGKELYETFIKYYSEKQWGCPPSQLPASIIKRLPVRFNYNSNYHKSKFVGIPVEGYTGLIKNILNHPDIEVILNTRINRDVLQDFDHLFYCGPIDKFYDYKFGNLGYRTVYWQNHFDTGDFQGVSQVNYTEMNVPFTRIIEHKHFTPWNDFKDTIYSIEFSKETGKDDIPYYPKRLESDMEKLIAYRNFATENETNISFLGRLATYRYMDMDKTIYEALTFAKLFLSALNQKQKPVFPNNEA